ncbi:MAG: hypothetical protein P4L35_00315 [Ignavibacteriaceae bacterium]|nr:hypothetical protein [Ignavibacteriaceae bacterium]
MRSKILFSIMFLFVLLYVPANFSQNPTWNYYLANDALTTTSVTNDTYQVDVIFLSTDVNPIELAAVSLGLTINNAALNGGTPTASFVAASSELTNTAQIPTSFNATTISGTFRVIKVAGKTPPGAGSGSLISNVAPGTRIGRLQIKNTVAWVTPINIDTVTNSTYAWSFNAYVNGTNTNINSTGTRIINTVLPVELSTFTSNVNGRQVNLNWETKTEINSNKYEIERSTVTTKDVTSTWVAVGDLKAAGTSNSPKKYSYTDKNLQAGKYQYRLKMVDNNGSFKYSSVESAEVAIPKDFSLSQNYPNPFNPTTKIDYQVPVDAKVIMDVYNIAGQKVIELVNQVQSAGYYTVNFGSKLSSGVYIYRMIATDNATGKNFSLIKKMMLLK